MTIVNNAIEDLEKSKDKLYGSKIESENNEDWGLAEVLDGYIASIQLVIDKLSDDENFMTRKELIAKVELEDDTL